MAVASSPKNATRDDFFLCSRGPTYNLHRHQHNKKPWSLQSAPKSPQPHGTAGSSGLDNTAARRQKAMATAAAVDMGVIQAAPQLRCSKATLGAPAAQISHAVGPRSARRALGGVPAAMCCSTCCSVYPGKEGGQVAADLD